MKKQKISFILMLLGIIMFAACSDKDEPEQSFTISVKPATLSLIVGQSETLTVTGAPKDAEITWRSSNEQVAKVRNGRVEAVGEGSANIMVIARKGNISSEAQCQLTVKKAVLEKYISFDDAYLNKTLLEIPGLDANKDGEISPEEAKTIHKLDFSYPAGESVPVEKTIKSLKGLEYFVNLDTLTLNYHKISDATPISKLSKLSQLHLGGNPITAIDLSNLKELRDLRIFKCEIANLNLANNTKLEILDIHNTSIGSIDLTPLKELSIIVARETKLTKIELKDLPKLTGVDLRQSLLQEIVVSNLPKLEKLYIEQNQISKIQLSNLPELQHLVAYENQIGKIDFELPKLMFLTIHQNKITEADFSKMPMLFRCYMSNNLLKKADFSNNKVIAQIEMSEMPNLEIIDLKNGEFSDNAEYEMLYNNVKLKKIRVDSGAEEAYVKGLVKNFPDIEVITE
ncbi:MAG: Ig-like domain-containing protein [Prevotella sp.]|nr:Ig-like domain-containing protein [Prevotella sp.]MDY4217679.1 Ig-like domain-containing protein [Prevotella sp.]